MGEWWAERAPRERVALIGAGAALLVTMAYLMLDPLLAERRRLEAELPELRQDLAWMRDHLPEARALAGDTAPAPGAAGDLTPATVESSLRRARLAESLEGLRPQNGGVRVVFKAVPFPDLLDWLRDLRRRSGAVARSARIQRAPDGRGRVQARLTLEPLGGAE